MKKVSISIVALAVGAWGAGGAQASVVIDTVPVGNPGNAGELSGVGAGGYGADRICGAVDYTYNIGKYEVTAGQYTEFLNKVAATDTYGLYTTSMDTVVNGYGCNIKRSGSAGSYTYSVAADWASRPVNYVSYWDSCRFANWLHNGQPTGAQGAGTTETGAYTLTTDGMNNNTVARNSNWQWAVTSEDEWYKAAYHKNDGVTGNYFDYPTSSNSPPSNDLINPDPGNNANYRGNWGSIGPPYYRTVVGDFENWESPYGTFDQGGNVWEWNEAILYGGYRGLRGGSFRYDYGYDCLHAKHRDHYAPPSEDFFIGFRLSAVPEPGSIAVLAVGCVGMLLRRRGL